VDEKGDTISETEAREKSSTIENNTGATAKPVETSQLGTVNGKVGIIKKKNLGRFWTGREK